MSHVAPLVSYMLVAFRPFYASRLICEVVRKTSVPYELLVWMNVDNLHLEGYIAHLISQGYPVRIVGKTPENIGMSAFKNLLVETKGQILCQLEDDVIYISRYAAEVVNETFNKYQKVHMVSSHVWQDEYTTGCRPPFRSYTHEVPAEGLYQGPIDGPLAFYRRENIPLMLDNSIERYFGLGCSTHGKLMRMGLKGLLSIKIMAFHIHGPIYHSYYEGALDFEIAKFRGINYLDVAEAYEEAKGSLPPRGVIEARLKEADGLLESMDFRDLSKVMALLNALEKRIPTLPPNSTSDKFRVDRPGRRGCWHYYNP